jgi:hypothetical protein
MVAPDYGWSERRTWVASRTSQRQTALPPAKGPLAAPTSDSFPSGPCHNADQRRRSSNAIANLDPELNDFTDTAAVISLDLVISVDTAVAHLAGAMGKPRLGTAALSGLAVDAAPRRQPVSDHADCSATPGDWKPVPGVAELRAQLGMEFSTA